MRIAFIHTAAGWPRPSIGLAYVMTHVEKIGHEAFLIDTTFMGSRRVEHILKRISDIRPDVVAYNSVFYENDESFRIAEEVRKTFPRILSLWGGVSPSLIPRKFLKNDLVDFICVGEGEIAIPSFLSELEFKGRKRITTPGISYRRGKRIVMNKPLPPHKDLDSLGYPDWSKWDMDRYMRTSYPFSGGIGVLASRGCPFNCTFCMDSVYNRMHKGAYYRARSPENVIEEIRYLWRRYSRHGLKSIYFLDETFGFRKDDFFSLMDLFVQSGLSKKLKWACGTRADVIDEDWVMAAKKAGCINVNFGIETSDEKTRNKVYRKSLTNKQIEAASGVLRKHGLSFSVNIIVSPYEDRAQALRSVGMAMRLKPMFVHVSPLTALPENESFHVKEKEDVFLYKRMLPYKVTKSMGKRDMLVASYFLNLYVLISFYLKMLYRSPISTIRRSVEFIFNIRLARPTSFTHPSLMLYMSRTLVHDPFFEILD